VRKVTAVERPRSPASSEELVGAVLAYNPEPAREEPVAGYLVEHMAARS
jgi:hypothetical protein